MAGCGPTEPIGPYNRNVQPCRKSDRPLPDFLKFHWEQASFNATMSEWEHLDCQGLSQPLTRARVGTMDRQSVTGWIDLLSAAGGTGGLPTSVPGGPTTSRPGRLEVRTGGQATSATQTSRDVPFWSWTSTRAPAAAGRHESPLPSCPGRWAERAHGIRARRTLQLRRNTGGSPSEDSRKG